MEITHDYDKHRTYIKNIPSEEYAKMLGIRFRTVVRHKGKLIILHGIFDQEEILKYLNNLHDSLTKHVCSKKDILSDEYINKFRNIPQVYSYCSINNLILKFKDFELNYDILDFTDLIITIYGVYYMHFTSFCSYTKFNNLFGGSRILLRKYNDNLFTYFCKLYNYSESEDIYGFKENKVSYKKLIQNILNELKSNYYEGLINGISPEKLKEIEDKCLIFKNKWKKYKKYICVYIFYSIILNNLDDKIKDLSPLKQCTIKFRLKILLPKILNAIVNKQQTLTKDIPTFTIIIEKQESEPELEPEPEPKSESEYDSD
jgi:hypothetical protein